MISPSGAPTSSLLLLAEAPHNFVACNQLATLGLLNTFAHEATHALAR